MKYRIRPADDICSLEELFTKHLGLDIPIVPQTSSYSNKHTFSCLFFSQNINQSSDIDQIMEESVFKDAEIDNLKADAESPQKPVYYLIHPSESYPTGTKLSVFFSNLANKNFSGNEQPLPIRRLLNAIDFDKMCAHLDCLIDSKQESDNSFIVELQTYISRVLATDSALTNYCALFKCAQPSEYLATFLLYSLFDDINFPLYASEVALSRKRIQSNGSTPAVDLNNPHFHKLMNDAKRTHQTQTFATYTLISLYAVQMLGTIFSLIWIDNYDKADIRWNLFIIVMLCTSIILTALRFIPFSLHKKYSELSIILEHSILDEKSNTYSITWKHFQNCSDAFNAMQHNRRILITVFCIIGAVSVIISFKENSFPLLVTIVSLAFGIMLILDSGIHDHTAYKKYDTFFMNSKTDRMPSSRYGAARMCEWDYDYKLDSFRHTNYNRLSNYSEDCIRCIYDQVSDMASYSWNALTAFIITLSSIGVIAEIMQLTNYDPGYFRIPQFSTLYIISMILILLNGILNILILLRARTHFQKLADFSYYAGNPDFGNLTVNQLFRHHMYAGNISDLAIARGIYNYNFCKFEEGVSVSDIQPPDDRYHPMYIVNQKIHMITDVFLCIIVAYFSMAVWHTNNLRNIIGVPVLAIIYIVFTFLLYPVLKSRSLKRSIRKLLGE